MFKSAGKPKKIYLINRDFQLRYAKLAVVVGLVTTLLTTFLILYPMVQFKIIRGLEFVPWPFLIAMVLAAALNFSIIAGLGILITHRMAGPMFSLVRQMRLIKGGSLNANMSIRKDDDMRYLVRNFNDLIDHLATQTEADRRQLASIVDCCKNSDSPGAAKIAEGLIHDYDQRLEGVELDD